MHLNVYYAHTTLTPVIVGRPEFKIGQCKLFQETHLLLQNRTLYLNDL